MPLGLSSIVLSARPVVNNTQKQFVFRQAGLPVAALAVLVAMSAACRQDPASVSGPAEPAEPAESAERPAVAAAWKEAVGDLSPEGWSVVLITIDTLRADRLGCYGYADIETPHLDRLAGEGILFENAVTTVPFTLPAHSSIMTGAYPPVHGVRENVGYALDERLPTLAEDMSAAGRRTGGFISAFVLDGRWGIDRGFERYYDEFKVQDMGTLNIASVQREGTETMEQAETWLDDVAGSPFFLWLHLFEPHDPYEAPEPFASRYPKRPYDAEVAYTDSLVGRLREMLEGRNLLDRTLLVVTGDHGEGLGDHGEYFHGFFVYDSTVRVPLIVRLPEGRLGGRRVDAAVSHVDLRPTILDALGLSSPPVDSRQGGRSLVPLLLGLDDGERVRLHRVLLLALPLWLGAPARHSHGSAQIHRRAGTRVVPPVRRPGRDGERRAPYARRGAGTPRSAASDDQRVRGDRRRRSGAAGPGSGDSGATPGARVPGWQRQPRGVA